jgi:hypothetical protein
MANHDITQFDVFRVPKSPYPEESKKEWPGSIPSSSDRIIKFHQDKFGTTYINYSVTYNGYSKVKGTHTLKGYIGDHIVLMDPYNKELDRFYKVLVYRRAVVCDNQIPVIPLVSYIKGEDMWNADKLEKVHMLPRVLAEIHQQEMVFHNWNSEFAAILKEAKEKLGDKFCGFTTEFVNTAKEIIQERYTSKEHTSLWKVYGDSYVSNTNHEKKARDAALRYQTKH